MLTFCPTQKQGLVTKPHRGSTRRAWSPQHPQVRHILRSTSMQPKLTVGAPNDKYEQEADRVAKQVMQMREPSDVETTPGNPRIQRLCEECEEEIRRQPFQEEEELLQAKRNSPNEGRIPGHRAQSRIAALRQGAGGASLPAETLRFFEPRFGQDFGDVRVHTDAAAAVTASSINARAYTLGRDIVFGSGQYMPHTSSGRALLAHELTHVLQQRRGSIPSGVQRTIGDGHDLESPRFSGNLRLEAAFDDERYVQIGDRGEHVVLLQQALVDADHPLPQHGVDGIFGPETHRAVRSYQDDKDLRVDGIVGPETMGDLDRFFTKRPPGPNVCSTLLFEQGVQPDENDLIFVKSLSAERETAAKEFPTVDLPDGEIAIECKNPPRKNGCKDLCGCPLPSSGFTGAVGGLARTLANATAFHEEDPQPNKDRRQLLCPPTNTPVKIQKIIPSGGLTFLEVLFCDGPLPDKKGKNVSTVLIQQQFVEALPVSITSETVETSPGARTRTDIGVGENVTLTHSSSCSVTWTTTAGTLFPVGNTAILTAPDTAQKVTVTAGGATKTFNVVAPTSVAMDIAPGSGVKHTLNKPDSGIHVRVFLGPATVNFTNVSYRELDVAGVPSAGAGAYSCNPFAAGHCAGAVAGACPPITMTNTVVATKGTRAAVGDCAYSGHCGGTPPFTPGSVTITIPYEYRVGAGAFHAFANVIQVHALAADASTLTTDKSTARGGTTVASPTTAIAACP